MSAAASRRTIIDPQCTACDKTMRLVGRERHTEVPKAELLTFECTDCKQLSTVTTGQ